MITAEESGRLDAAATEPVDVLMERAGYGVALAAVGMGASYGTKVAVLAGKGNNGGDGYVAARHLARRGCAVVIHAFGEPTQGGPAARASRAAISAGVQVVAAGEPPQADLVIDALFGVGFRGSLPEEVGSWIDQPAPVLAVDIPSGLDADTGSAAVPAFRASRTVTFHALKPAHLIGEGPDRCGDVSVVDIGLKGGRAAFVMCDAADAPRPQRRRTAHKWDVGSVVVVGGSPGISGAPLLAANAALAMGAGSVGLLCPTGLADLYAPWPDVMTRSIGNGDCFTADDVTAIVEGASRFDVMVLGPGIGRDQEDLVTDLLNTWDRPMLLDADGLNALTGPRTLADRTAPTVITPHAGEFTRLTGGPATYTAVAKLSEEAGVVALLKGAPTFVAGSLLWAVTTGGPELATIGTGDVLSGAIGALWARGLDAEAAARSGAYWHGVAGAAVAERETLTASSLTGALAALAR